MQRQRVTIALAGALMAAPLSSCGADPPPHRLATSFPTQGFTRVFEQYDTRATGADRTMRVRVPPGTRVVLFRLDCLGDSGQVNVDLGGFGGAGSDCRDTGTGYGRVRQDVGAGDDPVKRPRTRSLTVTAPPGSRWSVAIDVSTKAP